MNHQRLILFVLVILFCVAALWSYNAIPRPKTVSAPASPPAQPPKAAEAVPAKPVAPVREADNGTVLKLNLLDEPAPFKGYRRNIFKPVFVDEVKVAKQKAVAVKPLPQAVAAPPVQPAVMQPETAPLARFTFLGFLKKGTVKTIFLAKEKDILLVKKGDKIAGRYEATEISDQALTLTVADTGDEIVIPLLENRPLATAR